MYTYMHIYIYIYIYECIYVCVYVYIYIYISKRVTWARCVVRVHPFRRRVRVRASGACPTADVPRVSPPPPTPRTQSADASWKTTRSQQCQCAGEVLRRQLEKNSEVDALGVRTISRGCFERCCSNKKTAPYHSNLSLVMLRNRRPTLRRASAYRTPSETSPRRRCGHASRFLWLNGNLPFCNEMYVLCSRRQFLD